MVECRQRRKYKNGMVKFKASYTGGSGGGGGTCEPEKNGRKETQARKEIINRIRKEAVDIKSTNT